MTALVDALATYRLVRLCQVDDITEPARDRVYGWLDAWRVSRPDQQHHADKITELLECPWCLSIWIGVGVALARHTLPRLWHPAAAALASSTATGVLATALDRLDL